MRWDEPGALFGLIFLGGSLGGLAALLRSNRGVTWRNVCAAMLNSGFITLIIALAWYENYSETNLYFLIGISLLAGLGGATSLDLALVYVQKRLGIKPRPEAEKKEEKEENEG